MELYRWQQDCLERFRENHYRGIVHVVTGAGKTRFALEALDELLGEHPDLVVRIVVPTIPLAHQWKKVLLHHAASEEMRPGFFGGGRRDDPDCRVMIYIINSAREALSGHIRRDLALGHPVFLICDECHHYQSKENRKIFGFLSDDIPEGAGYYSLGLSATPFGTGDDRILTRSLGKRIFQYGFGKAVEDGVISPFTVCEISASFYPHEYKKYLELSEKIGLALSRLKKGCPALEAMGKKEFMKTVSAMARDADMDPEDPAAAFLILTYQRKMVTNLSASRIACGISLIERLSGRDRILVFCERISQAETFVAMVRKQFGNVCGIYHSEMIKEARTRVLDEFREGRIRILVSCRCLDEGIDVPDANIGIVLSSSAVERQRIQRLGRVVRRSPGKSSACLYYIYIRESSDDAAYLQGLDDYESFGLRYYTQEDEFSNDIYEYAARELVRRAEKAGYSADQKKELIKCITEGLVRADYLSAEPVPMDPSMELSSLNSAAGSAMPHEKGDTGDSWRVTEIHRDTPGRRHERNYRKVMNQIREMFL